MRYGRFEGGGRRGPDASRRSPGGVPRFRASIEKQRRSFRSLGSMIPDSESDAEASPAGTSREGCAESDRIVALRRRRLAEAEELLAKVYQQDPAFGALLGTDDPAVLARTTFIFRQICDLTRDCPGTALACYRDGKMVGVLSFLPVVQTTWRQTLSVYLRRPDLAFKFARRRVEEAIRRDVAKLPRAVQNRHRTYMRLATLVPDAERRLQVCAIGVLETHRRQGIARDLLAALDEHEVWGPWANQIVVNTWTEHKVRIYERLGFVVQAEAQENGVSCWTLGRPVRDA